MGLNTTQPRFEWCVIEARQPGGALAYFVQRKRAFPGQLPGGQRIVGRAEEQNIASVCRRAESATDVTRRNGARGRRWDSPGSKSRAKRRAAFLQQTVTTRRTRRDYGRGQSPGRSARRRCGSAHVPELCSCLGADRGGSAVVGLSRLWSPLYPTDLAMEVQLRARVQAA